MIKSTVPAQVQTSDRPEEGGKVSLTRPDGLLIKILSIESEGGGLSCHRCRKWASLSDQVHLLKRFTWVPFRGTLLSFSATRLRLRGTF